MSDLADKIQELITTEKRAGRLSSCSLIGALIRPLILEREAELLGGAPIKVPKSRLDALFDALALVEGGNTKHITKAAKGKIVTARKQIMEVSPEVTPQQIAQCAKEYKRKWPTWKLSSMSLCTHWHELVPAEPTEAAKDDIYQEPEGDWRSIVPQVLGIEKYPSDWARWSDIPANYRAPIKKAARLNGAQLQ